MSNKLFNLWESISEKETIRIAIDYNSIDLTGEEITKIAFLNYTQELEIYTVTSQESTSLTNALKIKKLYMAHNDTKEDLREYLKKWSRYYGELPNDDFLSDELIESILHADVVVTNNAFMKKLDLSVLSTIFHSKCYIDNFTNCLSAIRAWINSYDAFSFGNNSRIVLPKWQAVTFANRFLMPYLQDAWAAAVATKQKRYILPEVTINDYLASILSRLRYIFTTRDILETLKLKSYKKFSGNPYGFRYLSSYYFGYILILATALIDSVGCVLCFAFDKKIKHGAEVSLREENNKKYKSIFNLIQNSNEEMAAFLNSAPLQSFFELLYYLRNSIAHRSLPDPVHYSGNMDDLSGHLLSLNGGVLKRIEKFSENNQFDKNQLKQIGIKHMKYAIDDAYHELCLESILFSRFLVAKLAEFLNESFRLILLPKKMNLTEEEEKEFNRLKNIKLFTKMDYFEQTTEALTMIEASIP